ncbi:MAG: LLM class flavin-dependent oxidoreductase [Ktedonobacterales bacterium]
MEYGLSIPNWGDTSDPRTLAALAHDAEQAGWDGFFLWDHITFGPFPTSDPWVDLASIALATERIRIGTLVTPLPRRRITKLARETTSIDQLSHGRLILGVGIGAGPWEWEQLGETTDLKVRGAMLDEGLDLLTQLWSGRPIRHAGEHYTVRVAVEGEPAPFLPAAVQSPRIPIWVAGTWPNKAPFRRAARWDGVVPQLAVSTAEGPVLSPDQTRAMLAYVQQHRTDTTPFDVLAFGATSGDDVAADAAKVAAQSEAGATWWIEDLSPFTFDWDWSGPWPSDAIRARIRRGPPRA